MLFRTPPRFKSRTQSQSPRPGRARRGATCGRYPIFLTGQRSIFTPLSRCGYEPHRWWFQCPLEYQTWRLNISQLTTDWTRDKCPHRSRPQNTPIVPQGDLLPTLKFVDDFRWPRSYSWRQSGEGTMPRTMMPKTTRPTRPTRTTGTTLRGSGLKGFHQAIAAIL